MSQVSLWLSYRQALRIREVSRMAAFPSSIPFLQLRWTPGGNRHNNKDEARGGSVANGWEDWDDTNPLTQTAHF